MPPSPMIFGKPQRKKGPREMRKEGRFKLASERAGIKPMTATQAALDARDMSWAGGGGGLVSVTRKRSSSAAPAYQKRRSASPKKNAKKWFANDLIRKKAKKKKKISQKKLIEVFKSVDTDNSGYVELDEFIDAFRNLDLGLDVRQITELFREVDEDGSGAIDYREFKKAYESLDIMNIYIEQQMKQAGLSSRKAGPREMRARKGPKLASERAGIKPMTAKQMALEAKVSFTKKKTTKSSLKGFGDYNKKRRLRF